MLHAVNRRLLSQLRSIVPRAFPEVSSHRTRASMSLDREACKRIAAVKAVDDYLKDNQVIGIGSGSTIKYAVDHLVQLARDRNLHVKCVPTSFQARQLINEAGLELTDLERHPELDFAIDGADEVDASLNLIKGGGACLTQEKVVAASARVFLVIADASKQSDELCTKWKLGVPIEVIPMSYLPIKLQIERRYGGVADVRLGLNKAGPLITDNGNFVLDWKANNEHLNRLHPGWTWSSLHNEIKLLPGVIETGLCIDMATHVYFGMPDGTVAVHHRTFGKKPSIPTVENTYAQDQNRNGK